MLDIICVVVVLVGCFVLLRNWIACNIFYPTAEKIKNILKEDEDFQTEYLNKTLDFRNYYLFVLNPFLWSLADVFKDKEIRTLLKEIIKEME